MGPLETRRVVVKVTQRSSWEPWSRMVMSTDPVILGIDATPSGGASLLRGSEVVVAIKEERLSRVEGDPIHASLPFLALRYCQDAAGIGTRAIQLVVCRSDGAADRWPDDITLNPQLQIPRNALAWMTVSSDPEPDDRPSDAGVTAALHGLETKFKQSYRGSLPPRAGGRSYSADEVLAAVAAVPAVTHRVSGDSMVASIAERLSEGGTAGWFQGPSACMGDGRVGRMLLCGPHHGIARAGARVGIELADGQTMHFDIVMAAEEAREWCDAPAEDPASGEPRHLWFSSARWHGLPSALQGPNPCSVLVVQPTETRLHGVLKEIRRRTDRPFAYCAPFRAVGEPVVETPDDAVWTALQLGLDICALDDGLVEPADPSLSLLDLVPAVNDVECMISGDCRDGSVDGTRATTRLSADVMTPWGTTTRTINPLQLALLMEMDGTSNGWQLLEQVNRSKRTRIAAPWLLRSLAELRRLGIIALDAAPDRGVARR